MTICHAAYHADVLRASSRVPSSLREKPKERPFGSLKISPILKILVLVKERISDQ